MYHLYPTETKMVLQCQIQQTPNILTEISEILTETVYFTS